MKTMYVDHAILPAEDCVLFVDKLMAPPTTLPEFLMADQIPTFTVSVQFINSMQELIPK
jgi:hypothetical protein